MRPIPLTLAACLAPAAVFAQAICPAEEDLEKGIRFDVAGGEYETFQRTGDDIITSRYYFDAQSGLRSLLAKGMYLVETVDFEDGSLLTDTRTTYSYPLKPAEMPDVAAGLTWNTAAVTLGPDGLGQEAQTYSFGDERTIVIGACSFRMIPVTIRYPAQDSGDAGDVDTIHYLLDVGVGYLAAASGPDFNDTYDYIGVSLLP
ncbi:MAG: hypothetical protein AAF761_08990 [Pseudomonadota bacterium]